VTRRRPRLSQGTVGRSHGRVVRLVGPRRRPADDRPRSWSRPPGPAGGAYACRRHFRIPAPRGGRRRTTLPDEGPPGSAHSEEHPPGERPGGARIPRRAASSEALHRPTAQSLQHPVPGVIVGKVPIRHATESLDPGQEAKVVASDSTGGPFREGLAGLDVRALALFGMQVPSEASGDRPATPPPAWSVPPGGPDPPGRRCAEDQADSPLLTEVAQVQVRVRFPHQGAGTYHSIEQSGSEPWQRRAREPRDPSERNLPRLGVLPDVKEQTPRDRCPPRGSERRISPIAPPGGNGTLPAVWHADPDDLDFTREDERLPFPVGREESVPPTERRVLVDACLSPGLPNRETPKNAEDVGLPRVQTLGVGERSAGEVTEGALAALAAITLPPGKRPPAMEPCVSTTRARGAIAFEAGPPHGFEERAPTH